MSKRYIEPIILWEERPQVTKERTIEIYKNEVFKDIELYTYKHIEASALQDVKARNAVQADNSENMDGAVLARYVEFRDAQLRNKLQFALNETTVEYADDDITMQDNKYRYNLVLPESFNDKMLRPLAEYIHRFLVWGALYDWYSQFGMQQAGIYGSQLDKIEEQISGILRGPSITKRPLQPFGPAHKIF